MSKIKRAERPSPASARRTRPSAIRSRAPSSGDGLSSTAASSLTVRKKRSRQAATRGGWLRTRAGARTSTFSISAGRRPRGIAQTDEVERHRATSGGSQANDGEDAQSPASRLKRAVQRAPRPAACSLRLGLALCFPGPALACPALARAWDPPPAVPAVARPARACSPDWPHWPAHGSAGRHRAAHLGCQVAAKNVGSGDGRHVLHDQAAGVSVGSGPPVLTCYSLCP
jgi:hypothetical protein